MARALLQPNCVGTLYLLELLCCHCCEHLYVHHLLVYHCVQFLKEVVLFCRESSANCDTCISAHTDTHIISDRYTHSPLAHLFSNKRLHHCWQSILSLLLENCAVSLHHLLLHCRVWMSCVEPVCQCVAYAACCI